MSISRRSFFRISVLPALAALAPGVSIFGQTDESDDRLASLRSKDFRDLIGTKFNISNGNELNCQAILTDVVKFEGAGGSQADGGDENDLKCFTLTFRVAGYYPLKQATYRIKNRKLGAFHLFFVPAYTSLNEPLLIATINRI